MHGLAHVEVRIRLLVSCTLLKQRRRAVALQESVAVNVPEEKVEQIFIFLIESAKPCLKREPAFAFQECAAFEVALRAHDSKPPYKCGARVRMDVSVWCPEKKSSPSGKKRPLGKKQRLGKGSTKNFLFERQVSGCRRRLAHALKHFFAQFQGRFHVV